MLPLIILLVVFLLIAVRQIGKVRLQIWQIMLLGASGALFTGQIAPAQALRAINPDVMLFLFGMFIVGQALEESGYLAYLAYWFFRRARSLDGLVLLILFGMGLLSALLMNDTLAIIGTPVVLSLSRKTNMQPRILLLALAFAVTIGSVMSPIGNPQNLLIAINGGMSNPFITFSRYLFLPTMLNLGLAYVLLRIFYRKHFHSQPLAHDREPINDANLARLARVALVLLVTLIVVRVVMVFLGVNFDFRLTYIALIAALPIVLLSPRRLHIIRNIDWYTLIFFAAMFVLMESVWSGGVFQSLIGATQVNLADTGVILGVSTLLSQLISNVPLVALYLPLLLQMGATTKEMLALAAGSTIAGNLSILGAASNVIIIQNAERKSRQSLSFFEFVRIGIPLTILNVAVYWLFLLLMRSL